MQKHDCKVITKKLVLEENPVFEENPIIKDIVIGILRTGLNYTTISPERDKIIDDWTNGLARKHNITSCTLCKKPVMDYLFDFECVSFGTDIVETDFLWSYVSFLCNINCLHQFRDENKKSGVCPVHRKKALIVVYQKII